MRNEILVIITEHIKREKICSETVSCIGISERKEISNRGQLQLKSNCWLQSGSSDAITDVTMQEMS